ncbi:MAG TPA: group III truncated hemoglobin [Spongiibacteraceae bacterium]|jgi:hemoglobin
MTAAAKPDLDSPEHIRQFVAVFYGKLLRDEQLASIFIGVARIDLEKHLPLIRSYWEKLLLGRGDYRRHTMNIHRALHDKRKLQPSDFERWLGYFHATVDEQFAGEYADHAKQVASYIAANMQKALNPGA